MTPGEFIEVFDTVAEAPGGIERLRELVLQLAVRGRLVPQDGRDGEGEALLSLLKKARIKWKITRRIRKQKDDCTFSDRYVDIPQNWTWARLYEIGQTQTGTSPSSNNADLFGDYIPFIKPGNMGGVEINYDGSGLSKEGIKHSRFVPANSILMVCIGATLGKVNKTTQSVCFNQQINSLTTYLDIDTLADYIVLALKFPSFQKLAWSKAGTGTLPIISKRKWEVLPIPLPPLAEQHRIVAKVDELMGLIDRLAVARRSREVVRTAARDSALAALRNASTSEDVETAWTRIVERMEDLFTASADLAPLREAVLQLAVRGRLVPQDSGDESAAVLLEHIAEERARLVRAKKISKQKPVPDLDHSATAVELPSGWIWTCTAALGVVNPRNVAEDDAMVSFCPMPVIPTDYRQRIAPETRRWGDIKKGYTHFAEGDVVVAKITPCFQNRKSCVMTGLEGGIGAGTTELHVIRIIANKVVPEYLLLFYKSPDFLERGVVTMTGTAGQQRVPREYFAYTPLPLPPLAEQHRIVAKVDELMGLIDRLEQHLVAKEDTQGDFAVAISFLANKYGR